MDVIGIDVMIKKYFYPVAVFCDAPWSWQQGNNNQSCTFSIKTKQHLSWLSYLSL